ncbi:MAG: hypothetical protein ABIG66_01720 [Candidatus Kerfeldbacteria bacterium]
MGDYLDDTWEDMDEELGDEEEMIPTDPFEGLGKRDQDVFFRVLDLMPDGQREVAIEYFMDNPAKIRAIVDIVKQKKDLITNKDTEGLKKLMDEEHIVIEKIDQMAV